ncbi:MAG: AMP-binding protein [Polyangiaceae bacterium]|nr:AMP-binding protein [Polyangiaceae bacterium]
MPATRFANLVEMWERSAARFATAPLFGAKVDGTWRYTTYGEVDRRVRALRASLGALGVGRGDRVALVCDNRVEWAVVAHATYGLGAALVPMYEAQRPEDWEFVCRDAGAKLVVAGRPHVAEACRAFAARAPSVAHVIGLEAPRGDPSSYAALLAQGAEAPRAPLVPAGSDTATILYTAGTTGRPKGAVLTHDNIASNVWALHELLPLSGSDRSLCYLPWAHAFGHTCELHALSALGASLALAEANDRIVANLAEVSPTILVSVPLVFQRLRETLERQLDRAPRLLRTLCAEGLAAAQASRRRKLDLRERATLAAADRIVFARVRARLGGRLRYAFSGAAALAPAVADLIAAVGITVYEGYGLTETGPVVAANGPRAHRIGSVGKPVAGVRVLIDRTRTGDPRQGEIVVYGPGVMRGYHERPEETASVLAADGAFRTGDLGYLDGDGFLYVTGRLAEQYKLDNGKLVAPAPLEEMLRASPYVANVMIYGDNRPYNVALVVPDLDAVAAWARARKLHFAGTAELLSSREVTALLEREVARCSGSFRAFERVARLALVEESFTVDNGLLTPTHRVRRRAVVERHGRLLLALYDDAPAVARD